MNKSVWVIEKGSYSDYRVVGVYSTEAGARLVCDRINGGEHYERATVVEWPLDLGVEAINKGLSPFVVRMLRDGTTEQVRMDTDDFEYTLDDKPTIRRRSTAPINKGKKVVPPDCLTARVFAKDEAHAIKIVNEYRTQMIAKGEWEI